MLTKEMSVENLELLFLIILAIVSIFFFSRCSMKCKCKKSTDNYEWNDYLDGDYDDSAYSLPFEGGEIVPGAYLNGSVVPENTYADMGIGTF